MMESDAIEINQLMNPFHENDRARDKLQELEYRVNHQQGVIDTLMNCVGLLMRIQNIKDDRARKRLASNE